MFWLSSPDAGRLNNFLPFSAGALRRSGFSGDFMKKYLWIPAVLLLIAAGSNLETPKQDWYALKAATTANDTDHTLTGACTIPSTNGTDVYYIQPDKNVIEIIFTGGADGQSCGAKVYLTRHGSSVPILAWTGTITVGTQYWASATNLCVDTFASTTKTWNTAISEVDAGGNNRCARLLMDVCGYDRVWVKFYTGISSETFYAYISGY